jgi:hypothetical protein
LKLDRFGELRADDVTFRTVAVPSSMGGVTCGRDAVIELRAGTGSLSRATPSSPVQPIVLSG